MGINSGGDVAHLIFLMKMLICSLILQIVPLIFLAGSFLGKERKDGFDGHGLLSSGE